MKKTAKKRARIVNRIIYALLILGMLSMLGKVWYQKLNNQTPSLFGYQIYVVETGSMMPTLPDRHQHRNPPACRTATS